MTVAPGATLFERYLLEERIGQGGMATVWRARDLELGGHVALKRVSLEDTPRGDGPVDEALERALQEARNARSLARHPEIVTVHDIVRADREIWLVLEYLPGRNLGEIIRADGPLSPWLTARIGASVAAALAGAHDGGVVHRDVKPANVLVSADGRVKLADFGVSYLAGSTHLTRTGHVVGTVAYGSPEWARGAEPTTASDVFSLGATLFAALHGTPPFGVDENVNRMLMRVAHGVPGEVTAVDGPMRELIESLLGLNPDIRPDARTVADELRRLADQPSLPTSPAVPRAEPAPVRSSVGSPVGSSPEPSPHPSGSSAVTDVMAGGSAGPRRGRRRPLLLAAAGVLAAVAVVGVVLGVLLTRPAPAGGASGPVIPFPPGATTPEWDPVAVAPDAPVASLSAEEPAYLFAGPSSSATETKIVPGVYSGICGVRGDEFYGTWPAGAHSSTTWLRLVAPDAFTRAPVTGFMPAPGTDTHAAGGDAPGWVPECGGPGRLPL